MLDGDILGPSASFLGKPPLQTSTFEFFISSGVDVEPQRDEFEQLLGIFDRAFSRNLVPGGGQLSLRPVRWEDLPAHRYIGDPVTQFVAAAKRAHVTVALLSSSVRRGTREEILGVLETPATQLSVIVMPKNGEPLEDDLAQFLEENSHRFHYDNTRRPPSDPKTNLAMLKVISRAVADALNPPLSSELYSEQR